MNKNELRKLFLKKRQVFTPFKKPADLKIFQNFIHLPIVKKAKTICFYVSKKGEVDTQELIKYYLSETISFGIATLRAQSQKGKRIIIPKVVGKELELYEIRSFSDLSPGTFGILEPKSSSSKSLVLNSQVDLFVIPGLVFSTSGQRLGFGKGYYDRLLKNTKGFKLGLAYSWQIVDKLPEEKGDIKVNAILTEKGIISFF